jgi:uracil-DNA glycosylase
MQLSYGNDTLQESKMTTPLTWHDVLAEAATLFC